MNAFSGWDATKFQQMERICRLYQENFWNPEYSVEQFRATIAQPSNT